MPGFHFKYSPSASHRWLRCPASLNCELGEQTTSQAAEEGTAAHELAERCFVLGTDAADHVGKSINGFEVTEEMAAGVQIFLNTIEDVKVELGASAEDVHSELHIQHADHENFGGTIDCLIRTKSKIAVIDFKYGQRFVSAVNNTQLMCYAYLARDNNQDMILTIIQPRANCEAADIVTAASSSFGDEIKALTNGEVETPNQVARIKAWVADRGVMLDSLGKDVLAEVLDKDIPDDVRQILTIRQQASKSSTAKLNAFRLRCDSDGRVRGNLMYHGASTGRWSGTGIQIQNFPQGKLKQPDIDLAHRLLKLRDPAPIDMILGSPPDVISSMLRSFIRAEDGKRFLVGDFASIEARVLAWMSEQTELLAIFEADGDVYKVMASKIYDVEVEDVTGDQRKIGKMAILGLGYGMGWKAFQRQCRVMVRVDLSREFTKQVVKTYRETNSRIPAFWRECNTAAIRAIETGKPHTAGRITFTADSKWLKVRLPSGRELHYPTPELVEVRAPWSEGHRGEIRLPGDEGNMDRVLNVLERIDADVGEVSPDCIEVEHVPKEIDIPRLIRALGPAANAEFEAKEPEYVTQIRYRVALGSRWVWETTYAGRIVQNLTQAIARDFLCESMLRLEDHGYPIIATVHDEVIIELPEGEGTLDEFIELLSTVPRWGSGCPIASEGYEAKRYRK